MSRYWYLLITISAPGFIVTITTFILRDMFQTWKQLAQGEWLLGKAKECLDRRNSPERSYTNEIMAFQDIIVCYEMTANRDEIADIRNAARELYDRHISEQI